MPSCLVLESIIQDLVYEGGNHHEDPVIIFSLTSSRTDSIRALQYLVEFLVLLAGQHHGHRSQLLLCFFYRSWRINHAY